MKVILLKDVGGVGQRNSIKDVADGYALNFLIPRGLAEQASDQKIAELQKRMQSDAASSKEREAQWEAWSKQLGGARVVIHAKANERGNLYTQLSAETVQAEIAKQTGVALDASAIVFEHPIKTTGESIIKIQLGKNRAEITVAVEKN